MNFNKQIIRDMLANILTNYDISTKRLYNMLLTDNQ